MTTEKLGAFVWIAAIFCLFLYVVSGYFAPILWAVVFAVVFGPLRNAFMKRLRLGGTTATLLTMLATLLLVTIPTLVILSALANDAVKFQAQISQQQLDYAAIFEKMRQYLPASVSEWISSLDGRGFAAFRERMFGALSGMVGRMSNYLLSLGQNVLWLLIALGVMFYLLFFFLNDGERIRAAILRHTPLDDGLKQRLAKTTVDVIHATVQGNVIIAALQGAIGGITLWLLGVGGALVLGALMALFSLLPAVGASIVWIPIALWLLIKGDIASAVILTLVGALVIGLIDNLLRPPLVSKSAHLPDFLTFLSTIGGIAAFGLSGFVLGPLVAALFIETAKWHKETYMAD